MKKNFTKFSLVAIGVLMSVAQMNAQDASIGYGETDAWAATTTFNSSSVKEVTVAANSIKTGQICGSSDKPSHQELGGDGYFLDINLTTNSANSTITKIAIKANTNQTAAKYGAIAFSDRYPFDLNSIITVQNTDAFNPAANECNESVITPPAGTKSIRVYRRLYYWAADKKASTSSGSSTGRVQLGEGQTLRIGSVQIWVTPSGPSASLATSSGAASQEIMQTESIVDIVYTLAGGATNAATTVTWDGAGKPSWITVDKSTEGTITISGATTGTTDAGVFGYIITPSNGANAGTPVSGTITLIPYTTPAPTLTLSSGNTTQALKPGAITPIVFTLGNEGTGGASVTGLPAGVTGTYDATTHTYTIRGTVSAESTYPVVYNFTVTAVALAGYTGAVVTATGKITVKDPALKEIAYVVTNVVSDPVFDALNALYDVTVIEGSTVIDQGGTATGNPGDLKVNELSNYDLIVFHESLDGATYQAMTKSYVGVVPVLNMKPHFYNTGRWAWGTGVNGTQDMTVTIADAFAGHPIFNTLDISSGSLTYMTGVTSGNGIQGASGVTIGNQIASISAGVSIHEVSPGTTIFGRESAAKYLLVSAANANIGKLNANGVTLFTNAVAYLLSNDETSEIEFKLKWSEATVNDAAQTIEVTINSRMEKFGSQTSIETYFTIPSGYTLQIGGTTVVGNGDYFDYSPWLPIGGIPIDGIAFDYQSIPVTLTPTTRALPTGYSLIIHDLNDPGLSTGLGETPAEIVLTEYYTLTGIKLANPAQGILIKKTVDANGKTEVNKVFVK